MSTTYSEHYREALAEFIATSTEPFAGQTLTSEMSAAFAEWCVRMRRPFFVNDKMTGKAARELGTVTTRRTTKGTMWVGLRPGKLPDPLPAPTGWRDEPEPTEQ
jgi:hypothetical protein